MSTIVVCEWKKKQKMIFSEPIYRHIDICFRYIDAWYFHISIIDTSKSENVLPSLSSIHVR